MYHYMREESHDMPRVHCVKPQDFEAQVQLTKPMTRNQILNGLKGIKIDLENNRKSQKLQQGTIITFDDGIKDNLRAAEILEAQGSSGIFFLASKPYAEGEFLDVHMIHLIVYQENIDLVYRRFLQMIRGDRILEKLFKRFKDKKENMYNFYGDEIKRSDIKIFMNRICPLTKRNYILKELLSTVDMEIDIDTFYLTESEIKKIESMGMIIGGHSHSHNLLSRLDNRQQRYEIETCKKTIESMINKSINIFSYPYGRKESYNIETLGILKEKGFEYAFSVEDIDIEQSENVYELGRYNCNYFDSIFCSR